eukprot:11023203-Alexandrium_andersonii.AAC.1
MRWACTRDVEPSEGSSAGGSEFSEAALAPQLAGMWTGQLESFIQQQKDLIADLRESQRAMREE